MSSYKAIRNFNNEYDAIICIAVATKKYGFSNQENIKQQLIQDFNTKVVVFDTSLLINFKLPFSIKYDDIQSLGTDRMVGMYYLARQFKNKNAVIIDLGTCITYDFIDENNVFAGGIISPGLKMRLKSINEQTEKIPLFEIDKMSHATLGHSTSSCVFSGCYVGILNEIKEFLRFFIEEKNASLLVFTGGDIDYLKNRIINHLEGMIKSNCIIFDRNIILKSLIDIFLRYV